MNIEVLEDLHTLFSSPRALKLFKILTPIAIIMAMSLGWNYYDVMWWIQWYRVIEEHGIIGVLNIYRFCRLPECKVPYPPLAVLIFIPFYAITTFLPQVLSIILLKMFLVLIPGLIIYMIIKRLRGSDIALTWLLCIPFLQILFALQFDVLVSLLVLLSTYMMLRNRVDKSAVYLALATLVKHVAAIIVPLHVTFLWVTGRRNYVYKYILFYILVAGCIVAPFFIVAPKEFIQHVLLFHSSRAPQDLSLWALPTLFLEDDVALRQAVIDNLWVAMFIPCYMLTIYLFYRQLRRPRAESFSVLLPLYTSILLLLYITLNKVGNLNYAVWFVPTALIALSRKHIKVLHILTTVLGILGALTYAFMLYIPPASVNAPMFIVEDLMYWNARALLAQSLNYYLFYITSVGYTLLTYIVRLIKPISTPTDFASQIPLFKYLYLYRLYIMVMSLVLAQITLTLILILNIRWTKYYT